MPGTLDFSVVIVSWNVQNVLQHCLESIFRLPEAEQPRAVFVVDNASADGTVAMVKRTFPQVTVIENTQNRGFAAANNQAIAKIQSGDVLLLNPDTVVHPGAFARMLQAFVDHPKAGIVGPMLLNADGSVQPSVRRLPTPLVLVAIALKFRHFWKRFPPLQRYMAADLNIEQEQAVGQVMGAAFLIRRAAVREVGMLDEKFHIWFEEVDYCKRAADAGWETWYVPAAKVTHLGGESFQLSAAAKRVSYAGQGSRLTDIHALQPSLVKQRQWHQSVVRYSRKHFSGAAIFVQLASWLGVALTAVADCLTNRKRRGLVWLWGVPVLCSVILGLCTFRIGLLSDDWDWYYEARQTIAQPVRPLIANVGGAFYRPLATYSYALDYRIAPYNTNVAHGLNLLYAGLLVAGVTILLWKLTASVWVGQAGGVLFALWPQHLETLGWLGDRPDLLGTLFLVLGALAFLRALDRQKPIWLALAIASAVASFLSKETGVLAIPMYVLLIAHRKAWQRAAAWTGVVGATLGIGFFIWVRSIVLGQLIGGYGVVQTAIALRDVTQTVKVVAIGWLNWAWLAAHIGANTGRALRWLVAALEVGGVAALCWHWYRVRRWPWRSLLLTGAWFTVLVLPALPVMQSVNERTLAGTRYMFAASAALAAGCVLAIRTLPRRRLIFTTASILLVSAWVVNFLPWIEASAENRSILAQLEQLAPNPPPGAVIAVRGLPGETFGAPQWYARRSLPEAVVATYNRPDLYASTALETSPYCMQQPHGQIVTFSYEHATRHATYLGTRDVHITARPAAGGSTTVHVTQEAAGTYRARAGEQSWQQYRGLVVSVHAVESGFLSVQLRGEGSMLYNRAVVRVQPGRNDVYFPTCSLWSWLNLPPHKSVRFIIPPTDQVTAVHLVDPYKV